MVVSTENLSPRTLPMFFMAYTGGTSVTPVEGPDGSSGKSPATVLLEQMPSGRIVPGEYNLRYNCGNELLKSFSTTAVPVGD